MECIVETKNLEKQYKAGRKGTYAVKEVSMNIPAKQIYGFLGPNGAGKSTVLKMLTGIIRPSGGSITFDSHEWCRNDLQRIGALIETPPLYSNLTAIENMRVRYLMLSNTKKKGEEKAEQILEIVGLKNIGKKKAGEFSMGMKQRLGIGLSLLNDPKLLILDEPTNGLDPYGIEELYELLKSLKAKGMTIIISSHILSEVQRIADYIGIISDGELKYEGKCSRDEDLTDLFMRCTRKIGG